MQIYQQPPALIPGLFIGHATNATGQTGCSVCLSPRGAVAGAAVRGGAPGTRETDLLRPENLVDRIHAILLTGGSAFGLAAAEGVVRWLRERGHGWPTSAGPVPIVPAAVLFDLDGQEPVWPDAALGYAACEAARASWPEEGRVGAGAGALVGRILGPARASPGGIGAASIRITDGTTVGALVAVNAVGHVVDPSDNRILAGPRLPDGRFGDTVEMILGEALPPDEATHTTIGVVWTDAQLDKAGCGHVAGVAHDGLARTIRPAHTLHDGDTLFVLSLPQQDSLPVDLTRIGVAAAEVVAAAIMRAVTQSSSAPRSLE
jgi:L-aminopeptidase/D-esterase-like protein